jgi:glycosyltransferase involved in cell wall biosynthesis
MHAADSRIHFVSLSRNFGHQGGLVAGLENCRGDVAITLDADLQHPPALIPDMLRLWRDGYQVVNTRRREANSGRGARSLINWVFYTIMSRLSGIPLNERQSDFRLLDRKALDALLSLPEREKFLRGLTYWIGFRQESLPYDVAPRHAGSTKFNLSQLLVFAVQGVTSFSLVPLRLFVLAGIVLAALSFLYGAYVLIYFLVKPSFAPAGWASLAVGVFFLGGIQLIGIGVLGEYLGRVLNEVRGRPVYLVKEKSRDDVK